MDKIVNLNKKDADYIAEHIFDHISSFCDKVSFVIRDELTVNTSLAIFLESLSSNLVETKRTSEWPGTQLLNGQKATLRVYKLNPQVVSMLKKAKNLFNFRAPNLPEDVCFYRNDGTPFLVTISHEHDLYFSVNEGELEKIKDSFKLINFQS